MNYFFAEIILDNPVESLVGELLSYEGSVCQGWCHLPLISLKCSLRFPDNFHKIRHNGVVKGVGGAWRRVEPIGGYTKGGAYEGEGNIPSICSVVRRGHISLDVA